MQVSARSYHLTLTLILLSYKDGPSRKERFFVLLIRKSISFNSHLPWQDKLSSERAANVKAYPFRLT